MPVPPVLSFIPSASVPYARLPAGAALLAVVLGALPAAVAPASTSIAPLLAKLTAADGAAFDNFGRSVALDGGLALIGASHDGNAGGLEAGAAYVFDVSAFIPEPACTGLLAAAGGLLTRRRA
ncbi:MAG: FG-GAP repeat protein [Phycisphaerae bacterium]